MSTNVPPVLSFSGYADRISECASAAMENKMRVMPSFQDEYDFSGGIDWEQDRENSWLLYFHALMVVGCLAEEAEKTGDRAFAEKGSEIAGSWIRWDGEAPYAWSDHAVAYRTTNLLHLERACRALGVELPDGFDAALQRHGEWLAREENFAPNNHGLMAAMALFHLAAWRPDLAAEWADLAADRIRKRITEDVSPEGVHLEHAAGYHYLFLRLVAASETLLNEHGVSLFGPDNKIVEKMKEHLALLIRPDGSLPRVGDTTTVPPTDDFGHPWVAYALGRGGERPKRYRMVCPKSGTAIFRDGWGRNTAHVVFQCGFERVAHKHADDLGVLLYSGADILVGPGVYAYNNSKERAYIRSTQAHNTLTVDGRGYDLTTQKRRGAQLVNWGRRFVVGEHAMYDGVKLRRTLVLMPHSTIALVDEIESQEEHSVEQIFNLAPGAKPPRLSGEQAVATLGKRTVTIRQMQPASVRSFYGQKAPLRGFVSLQHGELTPIHQVEFSARSHAGNSVVFVTQISVTGHGEPVVPIQLGDVIAAVAHG